MPINQPSNQIKLTNVSVVRLKWGGKRFELACYKNKVLEWRSGVEKDIDEVLQIESVFTNVSKGAVASNEDVKKAFGDKSREDVVQEILKKGELQVGDKERGAMTGTIHKDIVSIISDKTVDPRTRRPYTTGMIDKALAEIGFSVGTTKSAKSQALDAIKMLQAQGTIPIERATMKVRVTCPLSNLTLPKGGAAPGGDSKKVIKDLLRGHFVKVDDDDTIGGDFVIEGDIQPGSFRQITDLLSEATKGKAQCEVLNFSQSTEGDETWS
ncbi:hypothetical protein PYCC9005_003239 [Savitreella phatthalungensis]